MTSKLISTVKSSSIFKISVQAILAALLGLFVYFLPFGFSGEENWGLELLFKNRGARPAPEETVLISIDKTSADRLGLTNNPERWPRRLHAQIIDKLAAAGAAVIVMDIYFKEPKDTLQDQALIHAVRQANNVILFAHLKHEAVDLGNVGGQVNSRISIDQLVPPFTELAQVATATAPFALPKVPVRINQFWTVHSAAGDAPTLPVVTLQQYVSKILLRMQQGPKAACAHNITEKLTFAGQGMQRANLTFAALNIRADLATSIIQMLETAPCLTLTHTERQSLLALINLQNVPRRPYLNFYGPPQTFKTIDYADVLHAEPHMLSQLQGKVVFIGFAEQKQAEQRDNFYTVFSQPDGLDLSGVEIGATAFANLLDGSTLKILSPALFIVLIVLYGVVITGLCHLPNIVVALSSALSLAVGYFYLSNYLFSSAHYWLPLVVPLLIQTPLALLLALWTRHQAANEKRLRMQHAFSHYLPGNVVTEIARNKIEPRVAGQLLHGVCLATDAENYTQLSEGLNPTKLNELINRYYAALFKPVRAHHGIISDVIGDAMLAIWPSPQASISIRKQACAAALDIVSAVEHFNRMETVNLRTRIGLHCGQLVMGSIGALDHLEYRAVGDVVNSANRIQNFNKQLGTTILCAEEVVTELSDFLTRKLGMFQFVGKNQPIALHELLGRRKQCEKSLIAACEQFEQALGFFQEGQWHLAENAFRQVLNYKGEDGPSLFFLDLCDKYSRNTSLTWQGVVVVAQK